MKQNKTKNKWVHVRVDEKTHKKLERQARPSSVSEAVRNLIELFINTKELK